jgi:diadenosine tetraphosphate (Ap4A) HIT family hydrolase
VSACPLCAADGGEVLWRDDRLRVIAIADVDHPAFLRVVWQAHVAEMTDLDVADREHVMAAVWATESALRDCVRPDKVNLASFGNVVPHLHWHVIARWRDDPHFPNAVWGPRMRESARPPLPGLARDMRLRLAELLGPGDR